MKENSFIVGSGDVRVLVLHGWFGDHAVWSPTFPYLDTERFTYLFIDYPGYGLAKDRKPVETIAELATDAVATVDALGWDRFALVGHSMGGIVAQRIATDAPERVSKLIGVTPVPATGVPLPPEADQLFDAVADSDEAGEAVVNMSLGNRLTPRVSKFIMRHARETATREALWNYGRAFRKTDFGQEASRAVTAPMLILYGEYDQGVSEEMVKSTFPALYPSVSLQKLCNVGHYPMLECPPALVKTIESFLIS